MENKLGKFTSPGETFGRVGWRIGSSNDSRGDNLELTRVQRPELLIVLLLPLILPDPPRISSIFCFYFNIPASVCFLFLFPIFVPFA